MQRKPYHLVLPLVTASLLAGCATPEVDTGAPAPKALLEAAEQATQMRMVYADVQARSSGHTVESVRLDPNDADAPDFMRSKVRLDYNGPMDEVLNRIGNDVGYRVSEYSKPASGSSWTPWVRLAGNKTVLDHMREINSQVPWHIVMDHINQRIVVDYSDNGGMANQVLDAKKKQSRGRGGAAAPNLPADPDVAKAHARRELAASRSNELTLPHAEAESGPPVDQVSTSSETWYLAIDNYSSLEQARTMVSWLGKLGVEARTSESGGNRYAVRIPAQSKADAVSLQSQLEDEGVHGEIGKGEVSNNVTSTPARAAGSDVEWDTPGSPEGTKGE